MFQEDSLADRTLGCLLGGACGDALGAPVEHNSLYEIQQAYGPHGVRQFSEVYGRVGGITGDTQLTLFTAEGLVEAFEAKNPIDNKAVLSTKLSTVGVRRSVACRSSQRSFEITLD